MSRRKIKGPKITRCHCCGRLVRPQDTVLVSGSKYWTGTRVKTRRACTACASMTEDEHRQAYLKEGGHLGPLDR